jgi:hypothetical protein
VRNEALSFVTRTNARKSPLFALRQRFACVWSAPNVLRSPCTIVLSDRNALTRSFVRDLSNQNGQNEPPASVWTALDSLHGQKTNKILARDVHWRRSECVFATAFSATCSPFQRYSCRCEKSPCGLRFFCETRRGHFCRTESRCLFWGYFALSRKAEGKPKTHERRRLSYAAVIFCHAARGVPASRPSRRTAVLALVLALSAFGRSASANARTRTVTFQTPLSRSSDSFEPHHNVLAQTVNGGVMHGFCDDVVNCVPRLHVVVVSPDFQPFKYFGAPASPAEI